MDSTSSKLEVFPLLSPVMEAELLKETWPPPASSQSKVTTGSIPSFWEENFQDLSDWCVDPQSIRRSHIPCPPHEVHGYHLGEDIALEKSEVKNYDKLSLNKSEFGGITEAGDTWPVENIESTKMSFEGSEPLGQDQFNIVTDISDVLLDLLPITSINEQQTIDNTRLIPTENDKVPDALQNLDQNSDTIETWLPIIGDNNIQCDESVANSQCNNLLIDSYQLADDRSTDDKDDKNALNDTLLTSDIGIESFDLLSYVFDEVGNNITEEPKHSTPMTVHHQVEDDTKSRPHKERRLHKTRSKAEPYVPPLKITIKKEKLPVKKRRMSKQAESSHYTDSESDAPTSEFNYRDLREKNNKASRKSRINKKVKESEMMMTAINLERDNAVLKMKVVELEKLVTSMRTALLQCALKKET